MQENTPRVYLDYNASTPVAPEVAGAMQPYFEAHYGNPSSAHWAGRPARRAGERARRQVADLLGAQPDEIVFTSGGSEANNLALKGVFFDRLKSSSEPPHVITTQIEHPAVRKPCHFLEELGAECTYLPVDATGRVDPGDVRDALRPETVLVSIMHANNEVGTIQPLEAIGEVVCEHGALFHTDAAQTVGKIPVDVDTLGVDLLSLAGHKFYALKGVGALYVRRGVALMPLIHGASHEKGRRAGTESVPLVVGLGAACELAAGPLPDPLTKKLRDYFWEQLQEAHGGRIVLHGHVEHRLPNTLNVGFHGMEARLLLERLEGVAASTGSACHAGGAEMSPVLAAMQVPEETGRGAIRFSLGRGTTQAEIDYALEQVKKALTHL